MEDPELRDLPLTAPSPVRLSAAAVLALTLTVLSSHLLSQAGPALTILSKDARRPLPLVMVSDQEFVALDDLAGAFQLVLHEEAFGALTVSYKGKTIVLTPDQTLASVSGRLISLPAAPTRSGRRWVVPVEFISRALAPIYDIRLDLRKPSRLLVVGDMRVPRVVVRYDPLGPSARLTVDATPRATATVSQDGQRLTIKFDADALDVPSPTLAIQSDQTLVQSVRVADATTLAVDLGQRFGSFRAASQPVDTTMRLVIDISAAQTSEQPAPPPAAAPPQPTELPPAFATPVTPLRTITIDPGHGGEDDGAKGAEGAKEKDLTLSVSRRAKAALEGRLGIRVILTRDDDRNVPIDERTAIANNNKADLFISVHANGSMRPSISGATIYRAAFDSAARAAAIAGGGERVPTFGGGLRDIELLRWDLAQTRHLDQSNAFAALLEQTFKGRIPLAARPSEMAPLRVLESANMPAVLIEMGYLTNPEQEKLLAGDGFQGALVQSLYDAVIRFRDVLAGGGTR
jgi:N-acetylmuramoyl-L-alanine amidase